MIVITSKDRGFYCQDLVNDSTVSFLCLNHYGVIIEIFFLVIYGFKRMMKKMKRILDILF